ncbi:hypothetical protein F511_47627 [Dorcoceras hygrometricum]|uniref:Uncharacterized protein n=1 Tax=Dorcoceras hygrometricum TaxID=472368 RepID=A0A2Z6ZWS6_9LAMI|nr:hypothetical protein F511_47627 [Dorcoceras hygrometricum]
MRGLRTLGRLSSLTSGPTTLHRLRHLCSMRTTALHALLDVDSSIHGLSIRLGLACQNALVQIPIQALHKPGALGALPASNMRNIRQQAENLRAYSRTDNEPCSKNSNSRSRAAT